MHLRKNVQSITCMAMTALLSLALAPEAQATQDKNAPPRRLQSTCAAVNTKGTLTPAITATPGDVTIDISGVAICNEIDPDDPSDVREQATMRFFAFGLKGVGKASCEGATTFTGELQIEQTKGYMLSSAVTPSADKVALTGTAPNGHLLAASGAFTSGLFDAFTIAVTLSKTNCPLDSFTKSQGVRLTISPPK